MKKAAAVLLVIMLIVAFAITTTTITILHKLIGMPQGAALGVGIALGAGTCVWGMKFFKGII
jgi:hypothetical protein